MCSHSMSLFALPPSLPPSLPPEKRSTAGLLLALAVGAGDGNAVLRLAYVLIVNGHPGITAVAGPALAILLQKTLFSQTTADDSKASAEAKVPVCLLVIPWSQNVLTRLFDP